MVSPARAAAYETVFRVFEQDAYADRTLRTAVASLDQRDRAFAQRLGYGTIQRVRTLDYAIEQLGRRPMRKLDPPVRAALRLGAYELGFMQTPRHAAVNEAVELVRRARLERAVAFTNAVLRRVADGIEALLESLPEGALKQSYPDWVEQVWTRDFGREQALALMRAQNEAPETVVRLIRGDIAGEPTDLPGAYRVARVDEEALAEGRIWPQSRGSQLAGLTVGARAGERTLDLCAAPGGKATMLAGDVTAVEKHPGRAGSSRRTRPVSAPRTSASSARMRWSCRRSSATTTGPSSTLLARALASSPRGRTCAGARSRCLSCSLRSWGRRLIVYGPAEPSSTPSARSTPTRTKPSSTRPASRRSRSARTGRSSLIRSAQSFC